MVVAGAVRAADHHTVQVVVISVQDDESSVVEKFMFHP